MAKQQITIQHFYDTSGKGLTFEEFFSIQNQRWKEFENNPNWEYSSSSSHYLVGSEGYASAAEKYGVRYPNTVIFYDYFSGQEIDRVECKFDMDKIIRTFQKLPAKPRLVKVKLTPCFLKEYWWLVLLVLGLVIAAVVSFYKNLKPAL